jgi:hypothetical protein
MSAPPKRIDFPGAAVSSDYAADGRTTASNGWAYVRRSGR